MTVARVSTTIPFTRQKIHRSYDTSGANAELTVSTETGSPRRLLWVSVTYSTSVTKSPTVVIDSGLGAAFDASLNTITITAAVGGMYVPDGEVWIDKDSVFKVTSPAGGGGVTSTVVICTMEGTKE